ncbi:MAG: aminodeoxychorismate synthase component I [Candidatus Altiarchaeota archaeon]
MAGRALSRAVEVTGEFFSDRACDLFEAFSADEYCFFLDGGCDPRRLGRYSIIGSQPDMVIRSKDGLIEEVSGGRIDGSSGDPLGRLQELLDERRVDYGGPLPFVGGAVGYLSYDLCQLTEGVRLTKPDLHGMPDLEFGFYGCAIVCDNLEGRVWLTASGADDAECDGRMERLRSKVRDCSWPTDKAKKGHATSVFSDFTKEGYEAAVRRVKDYIREGDAYQVNLSQRFVAEADLDGWSLYKSLRSINPAPFAAYLGFGDTAVISSSPERFLRVGEGVIETRPIKGTRPRGIDEAEDGRLGRELLASVKDGAEHVMIVDLERNDLGKVCEYGSVEVTEFEALESYNTVHHLVSTVRGRLRDGVGLVDCVRACFPGGSITGAPKVRAIEIIDELEPVRRGIYTGSIGYLGYDGDMDLNIVIRTVVYRQGRAFFNVGGGIVADSDPKGEYDETIDKARALLQSLGSQEYGMKAYVDGRMVDESEASVSPLDYGMLYGYGIYETMRADGGRVFRLGRHLARLREAARLVDIPLPWSDKDFREMIRSTLQENRLSDAYVRMTITRGSGQPRLDFPKDVKPTLIIIARKLPDEDPAPARLAVSDKHTRYSKDLRSRIKSTNCLISALAKAEAADRKVDDIILLNEQGNVTECSTANVFFVFDGRLVTPPVDSGLLPGIVREAILELAAELGIPADVRDVYASELPNAQEMFKTSSIAGVVPVVELDGRTIGDGKPGSVAEKLRMSYIRLLTEESS